MCLVVVKELASLGIELRDGTVLMAGDDVVGQVAESGHSGLAILTHNPQSLLVGLLCLGVGVDLVDDDGAEMAGSLLGNAQQQPSVGGEFDTFDGCREVPSLQQLARLDFPQAHRVVCATGREECGGGVDVDGPESTLVTVVGSQALTIVRD